MWNFVLEETFQKLSNLVYHDIGIKHRAKYNKTNVLFVDVSGSLKVIKTKNGDEVITDRAKLARLFFLLEKAGMADRTILCDLYFDEASADDSLLNASIKGFHKLLVCRGSDENEKLRPNFIRTAHSGPAGITTLTEPWLIFSNSLLKYPLVNSAGDKTLPLMLYEIQNGTKVNYRYGFLHDKDGLYLNTTLNKPFIDLNKQSALRKQEIKPIDSVMKMLEVGDEEFSLIKDSTKIVVIGNFKDDVHKTAVGDLPGPIIILNLFISMDLKENRIGLLWLIFVLSGFMFMFYKHFYHMIFFKKLNHFGHRVSKKLKLKKPLKFNFLIFYLLSVLSYIIFNIYLELIAGILFMGIFMKARDYILIRQIRWRRWRSDGRVFNLKTAVLFFIKKQGFKT